MKNDTLKNNVIMVIVHAEWNYNARWWSAISKRSTYWNAESWENSSCLWMQPLFKSSIHTNKNLKLRALRPHQWISPRKNSALWKGRLLHDENIGKTIQTWTRNNAYEKKRNTGSNSARVDAPARRRKGPGLGEKRKISTTVSRLISVSHPWRSALNKFGEAYSRLHRSRLYQPNIPLVQLFFQI